MLQILATFVTVAVNLFQRETVGTWNVMTMHAAGKLSQLTNEMTNNGLSNPWNQRGTINWFRTTETCHWTVAPVLWSRKRKRTSHKRGSIASVQISTERTNWLGSTLPPDHHGFLQDYRKQDSREHHSVLCPYEVTLMITSRRTSTISSSQPFRGMGEGIGDLSLFNLQGTVVHPW